MIVLRGADTIMAAATKVAVVTGGNKGIGLEIVRSLCKKFDGDVILTARDESKGRAAIDLLARESEVEPLFYPLDVSNRGSIERLSTFLQDKYGGLDILVNNAGIMLRRNQPESRESLSTQVRQTLKVNFWGCLDCCKVLFPHLRPGARVVNISSIYCRSTLRECSPLLKAQLTRPDITMEQLEKLMTDYQKCADAGSCHVNGWSTFAYGVSKIGVTVMTQIQQHEMDQSGHKSDILINSCCPGWCRTDLGGDRAPKSAAQGADTPVYLSLLPPDTKTPRGAFLSDRTVQKWG